MEFTFDQKRMLLYALEGYKVHCKGSEAMKGALLDELRKEVDEDTRRFLGDDEWARIHGSKTNELRPIFKKNKELEMSELQEEKVEA